MAKARKVTRKNGFHATSFELTDQNDHLTLALVAGDGTSIRRKTVNGRVRKHWLDEIGKAATIGEAAANDLMWALLGFAPRLTGKPLASAICHPGLYRVA